MIFAERKYPVNVKGCRTVFYPANSLSLGDNILITAIFRDYLRNNPEEEVSFVPFGEDIVELARRERPGKLFLRIPSVVTNEDILEVSELTETYCFELHWEAHELWKSGVYPTFRLDMTTAKAEKLTEDSWDIDLNTKLDYTLKDVEQVVIHGRNIRTVRGKNTNQGWLALIVDEALGWARKDQEGRRIILIGKDDPFESGLESKIRSGSCIYDLRHRLSLNEIYLLLERAKLAVMSDNGLAHLAGCSGVPMVSWGYESELWFPKVRNIGECLFLTRGDSKIEAILGGIRQRLGGEAQKGKPKGKDG